ncbi:hypothetical protein N9K06_00180 [Omnitrophica bacterium]|nr:hypothetical protein [Candidatus Omnitrophota bacterium]
MMTRRRILAMLPLLFYLLSLNLYAQEGPESEFEELPLPSTSGERFLILEDEIADTFHLVNERFGRLPSGQVQVTFGIENPTTVEDVFLEWKVEFYDAEGRALEETEWRMMHFLPESVQQLKANSAGSDAKSYAVIVRIPPSSNHYEAALEAAEANP